MDRWHRVSDLGSGVYGTVYKMTDGYGNYAALKLSNRRSFYQKTRIGLGVDILHEQSVLTRIQDPNIIRLYLIAASYEDRCLWKGKNVSYVQEEEKKKARKIPDVHDPFPSISFLPYTYLLLEDGEENMSTWRQRHPSLPLHDMIRACRDVMKSLRAVHSHKFCHNDLKPENFIRVGSIFKLSDFGISLPFTAYRWKRSEVQPLVYRAPELVVNSTRCDYSSAIDIWAAALTCIVIVFGGENCRTSLVTSAETPEQLIAQIITLVGPPSFEYLPMITKENPFPPKDGNICELIQTVQLQYGSSGCSLTRDKREQQIAQKLRQTYERFPQVLKQMGPDRWRQFLNFLAGCLEYDPKRRWTAEQCLSHPFLREDGPVPSPGHPTHVVPSHATPLVVRPPVIGPRTVAQVQSVCRSVSSSPMPPSVSTPSDKKFSLSIPKSPTVKELTVTQDVFKKIKSFFNHQGKGWLMDDEKHSIFLVTLHIFNFYLPRLLPCIRGSEEQKLTNALGLASLWLATKYLSIFGKERCVTLVAPYDDPDHAFLQQVAQFEIRLLNDDEFSFPSNENLTMPR